MSTRVWIGLLLLSNLITAVIIHSATLNAFFGVKPPPSPIYGYDPFRREMVRVR